MKLVTRISIAVITILLCNGTFAQKKVNLSKSFPIKQQQGVTKKVAGKERKIINSKTLSNGNNYLKLPDGRLFFIEVKNKRAVSINIANAAGVLQGSSIKVNDDNTSNYSCDGALCSCRNDQGDDCNEMFTNAGCGDWDVCVDNYCYCLKQM